jgi:L-asparaginase / beta-aspartyl-peptidase
MGTARMPNCQHPDHQINLARPAAMPSRLTRRAPIALVVHGGAWAIPDGDVAAARAGAAAAAAAGYAVLAAGGSALDAVETAVRVLEDDPVFDAGTGSVLNAAGAVECDALLVDGDSLASGGVIGLDCTRHPITVARAVMTATPHALLAGDGAKAFARAHARPGDLCTAGDLVTPAARAEWAARASYGAVVDAAFRNPSGAVGSSGSAAGGSASSASAATHAAAPSSHGHDTVGAVALDAAGRIAAGTSTGGITFKLPGRVGDSPLVGCGAYADSGVGGCSTTGHGESIMKVLLAHTAVAGLAGGGSGSGDGLVRRRHGGVATAAAAADGGSSGAGAMPALASSVPAGTAPATTASGVVGPTGRALPPSSGSDGDVDGLAGADAVAQAAAAAAVAHMRARVDGYGGLVLLSADGGLGVAHSTSRMAWAAARGVLAVEEREGEGGGKAPAASGTVT